LAQGAERTGRIDADGTRRRLGFKYYAFISQVENGFGRVPTEKMEAWAQTLGVDPSHFAKKLISFYEPELHRLLYKVNSCQS
jgi:transcriptional regulator with XRE-family HTH domain